MSNVRWGLVSTANINRKLIPAIHASRRGNLVAVASRSHESANAYAAEWEIPQAFASYDAMLNSDVVDVVYVGLPNHLHAEWSIKAMQAGKHVLCEKPFALTLEEVDEMTAVSEKTGCVIMEAFMYRHHPQTKIVGEWVRNGRLGEISIVRAAFDFRMSDPDSNVRMAPAYGGGCLWDVGVYPVSFAQYVMGGPPQQVFGQQWVGNYGVDEVFAGQLRYPGNRLAHVSSAFRTPFHTFADIVGTEGRLYLTRPFTGLDDDERRLTFYPAQGEPQEIAVPEKELYLEEVENMHAAILDGVKPYVTLAETRNHIRTVLALYQSAEIGTIVDLD